MNWEAAGAIAEGLGAIAVIMSVLYLALQIRAQTNEARLSATRELAREYRIATEHMFQDKELSGLHRIGIHDYKALGEDDRMRVAIMWFQIFRAMEQQYLHTKHQSIDDLYLRSTELSFKEFIAFPGIQTWWQLSGHDFIEEFRTHIDSLMAEAKATDFKSSFKNDDESDG
jgi:hypothetical protein